MNVSTPSYNLVVSSLEKPIKEKDLEKANDQLKAASIELTAADEDREKNWSTKTKKRHELAYFAHMTIQLELGFIETTMKRYIAEIAMDESRGKFESFEASAREEDYSEDFRARCLLEHNSAKLLLTIAKLTEDRAELQFHLMKTNLDNFISS